MSDDPLISRQLDEYRLETLLGQGGMARVYRAVDVRLRRYAALKVIDTPYQADPEYLARFEKEAQAIARLDHPHIVHLYRYGEADGMLYMAMQYVEGSDLGRVLQTYEQNGERMPPTEASRIIREVCQALDYAHSEGVIHRDIKPSNIILDAKGRAILADFGLVLFTQTGTVGNVYGTPQYMAPEQIISSAGAIPQSDLYAVGVILYRMFTGVLPFEGSDLVDLAMRHMSEPPRPPRQLRPELGSAVETVILRALAKDAKDRYSTGDALAGALEQALMAATKPIVIPANTMSVIERVTLSMDELPPIPSAVLPGLHPTPPVLAPTPGVIGVRQDVPNTTQPTADGNILWTRNKWVWGVGVGFVVLILLVAGLFLRNGRFASPTRTPTEQAMMVHTPSTPSTPPQTQEATQAPISELTTVEATPPTVLAPTVDSNDVWLPLVVAPNHIPVTPPVATPFPSPTTAVIVPDVVAQTLLIDEDGPTLYLLNPGQQPIVLTGLQLVMNGRNGDTLAAWNLESLDPGTCLLVFKSSNQERIPEVCERVVRGVVIFDWKNDFTVLYGETAVAECQIKNDSCIVTLSFP